MPNDYMGAMQSALLRAFVQIFENYWLAAVFKNPVPVELGGQRQKVLAAAAPEERGRDGTLVSG